MPGTISNDLKANVETIMKLWEARACSEVSSAATAETLALRDSLPIYLSHLSQALAENRKMDRESIRAHNEEAVRIGQMHGEDRAGTSDYLLAEVISEYHILREVIFKVLETKEPLPQLERDIILDSIEQAVNDASVKFSDVHADIQNKYISTLTHDLKNPLAAAKISAQLILKRSDRPDDCIRSASRIIGSINRVDSMVHDLLDANRLRAGKKLSLQFSECDLASILRDAVDEFRDIYTRDLSLKSDSTLKGRYSGDGIRRAAENLIGNAIKYSAPNTPIEVNLAVKGKNVELKVHNTGPVIEEKEKALLFQQYRRSKSAEESNKSGWGIGLTLVHGVAEAHNGTVEVESSYKRGTTFTIIFPVSSPNP